MVSLLASSGSSRVDELLRGLIGIFETAFPGRIRACYVDGSYADGSGLATSDVDLTLVFQGAFRNKDERRRAGALCRHCVKLSGVELDASVADEEELRQGVPPSFKLAASLIYGVE
ncbi:MAG: nucleotidyltransferase domain-containing protein, partial [Ktedonobacterales bacterium]